MSFPCKNLRVQKFIFSKKFMKYLTKNANAEIMQKFHRCCKYFFMEAPYFIVDTLEFIYPKRRIENINYDDCLDFMDENEFETFLSKIDNIWITNKLNTVACGLELIDKIVRSDAREIWISGRETLFEKFKVLTKSGNVEKLMFDSVIFSDGSEVPLESILALVPNASSIDISNECLVTPQTMFKLNEIPWKQKIENFCLLDIKGDIKFELFFNFIEKCMDPNAKIIIHFNDRENETFKKDYNLFVEKSFETMPKFKSQISFKRTKMYKKESNVTFTLQNIRQQNFALPYSILNHIRDNANGKIMSKFYQTCKFFYLKNPYCIIDSIEIDDERIIEFKVNRNKISMDINLLPMLENIWITNSIDLNCCHPESILKQIARCDADKLIILSDENVHHRQPLPLDDYKILAKSIKKFNSDCENLIGLDGKKHISLQELLLLLPNAKEISANVQSVLHQDLTKTDLILRENKIETLHLKFIGNELIDATSFYCLIKNSLAPKALIELEFRELRDQTSLAEFKSRMKAKIETWRPRVEKPSLVIDE